MNETGTGTVSTGDFDVVHVERKLGSQADVRSSQGCPGTCTVGAGDSSVTRVERAEKGVRCLFLARMFHFVGADPSLMWISHAQVREFVRTDLSLT